MNCFSRVTVTTVALLVLGVALPAGDAIGQTAKDLVGIWTPVSVQAFGPSPKGLQYTLFRGHYENSNFTQ